MHATDINHIKRAALVVGCIGTAVSMTMTAKFGWEISWTHAVGFAAVTVMAAIIFPFRNYLRTIGQHNAAKAFMALGLFFIAGEFFGDVGYTIGMRDKSIKQSGAQNVKYTDARDSVADYRSQLVFFENHLKKLDEANAWAPTVNAEALRARLASAELAIRHEADRGGCKAKCLERTKERDGLMAQIATAEDRGKTVGQIEATKRKIEDLRGKSASTEIGHTPVKSQSDFVAKLYLAFTGSDAKTTLNPDEFTLSFTEIFIGFFIALLATLLPTVAFYMAFVDKPASVIQDKVATALKAAATHPGALLNIGPGPTRVVLTSRAMAT